jgi:hypothetical protein
MEDEDLYSDPYENYCRLKRTITFLTNGGKVTEDWMEEHTGHIMKYNQVFPEISKTNLSVTDRTFRKTAQDAEVILRNLVESIDHNRLFNLKFYLMLNEHMIKLTEFLFTEEELEFCMSKLAI